MIELYARYGTSADPTTLPTFMRFVVYETV
jgi:hypothetical protein